MATAAADRPPITANEHAVLGVAVAQLPLGSSAIWASSAVFARWLSKPRSSVAASAASLVRKGYLRQRIGNGATVYAITNKGRTAYAAAEAAAAQRPAPRTPERVHVEIETTFQQVIVATDDMHADRINVSHHPYGRPAKRMRIGLDRAQARQLGAALLAWAGEE